MNEREHHETTQAARKRVISRTDRPGRYADVAGRFITVSLYSGTPRAAVPPGEPVGEAEEEDCDPGATGDSGDGEPPRAAGGDPATLPGTGGK